MKIRGMSPTASADRGRDGVIQSDQLSERKEGRNPISSEIFISPGIRCCLFTREGKHGIQCNYFSKTQIQYPNTTIYNT